MYKSKPIASVGIKQNFPQPLQGGQGAAQLPCIHHLSAKPLHSASIGHVKSVYSSQLPQKGVELVVNVQTSSQRKHVVNHTSHLNTRTLQPSNRSTLYQSSNFRKTPPISQRQVLPGILGSRPGTQITRSSSSGQTRVGHISQRSVVDDPFKTHSTATLPQSLAPTSPNTDFFYPKSFTPEQIKLVEQYADHSITTFTIRNLINYGVPNIVNVINSAAFLHKELPYRYAQRIEFLRDLPFDLNKHNLIQQLQEHYLQLFLMTLDVDTPSTLEDVHQWNEVMLQVLHLSSTLPSPSVSHAICLAARDKLIELSNHSAELQRLEYERQLQYHIAELDELKELHAKNEGMLHHPHHPQQLGVVPSHTQNNPSLIDLDDPNALSMFIGVLSECLDRFNIARIETRLLMSQHLTLCEQVLQYLNQPFNYSYRFDPTSISVDEFGALVKSGPTTTLDPGSPTKTDQSRQGQGGYTYDTDLYSSDAYLHMNPSSDESLSHKHGILYNTTDALSSSGSKAGNATNTPKMASAGRNVSTRDGKTGAEAAKSHSNSILGFEGYVGIINLACSVPEVIAEVLPHSAYVAALRYAQHQEQIYGPEQRERHRQQQSEKLQKQSKLKGSDAAAQAILDGSSPADSAEDHLKRPQLGGATPKPLRASDIRLGEEPKLDIGPDHIHTTAPEDDSQPFVYDATANMYKLSTNKTINDWIAKSTASLKQQLKTHREQPAIQAKRSQAASATASTGGSSHKTKLDPILSTYLELEPIEITLPRRQVSPQRQHVSKTTPSSSASSTPNEEDPVTLVIPIPRIRIDGHIDTTFRYPQSHMKFIIKELLTNAIESTITSTLNLSPLNKRQLLTKGVSKVTPLPGEDGASDSATDGHIVIEQDSVDYHGVMIPPVKFVMVRNGRIMSLKLTDRGNGIERNQLKNALSYGPHILRDVIHHMNFRKQQLYQYYQQLLTSYGLSNAILDLKPPPSGASTVYPKGFIPPMAMDTPLTAHAVVPDSVFTAATTVAPPTGTHTKNTTTSDLQVALSGPQPTQNSLVEICSSAIPRGYGLPLAKATVNYLSGELSIASVDGFGTDVYLNFKI